MGFFKQNIEVCLTIHKKEYWPKYSISISQIFSWICAKIEFDWAHGLSQQQQQQKTKSPVA